MIRYLFTAIWFPLGSSGRKTCTKIRKRQLCTKRETVYKTIHKHRINEIENKYTQTENKHEKNIKNHRSSN